MITTSGYQFGDLIHESANSLIYRGRRRSDNQPVILKTLKSTYPSPEQIARLKAEYEIIRSLDLKGVVNAQALEKHQQRWVMVLDDFGGQSLAQLGLAGKLDLLNFLTLAIRVTEIVGQIHQRHVIHQDLNPSNIVVISPDSILDFGFPILDLDKSSEIANLKFKIANQEWPVKIIDFGISTVFSHETTTLHTPSVLQGTLAYISPEQTGRMNRAVDYRTDFYSLGVTFYELLTGQLPFQNDDPLELVHSHIAKQPPSPYELKPVLPPTLSDIIMKLLAKNAEERYQSAYGLKADLEECLRQWQTQQQIAPFLLGQQDISDRLQIPQKLYGREQELEILSAAFEQISSPSPSPFERDVFSQSKIQNPKSKIQMALVTGHVGIGKSALVHELDKLITRQRGYFICGKFDQFQRNVPYISLIQAFHSLVQQLLAENKTQIAVWQQKLLTALGPNGQVILEVIPEIELIIGPQPQVPALGPVEAQNRFNLVFQNFIKVFARPEHPLVIFLDDLQWADEASLKLIERLMTAPDSNYLFLIGAYRDAEMSEPDPLLLTLDEIKTAGVTIKHIPLPPLNLPHVTRLVADTLRCEPKQAAPLAELVLEKTGGNPFFMGEFLKSLHSEKFISFDHQRGSWQWNLAQIQTQEITDNVVELMADKVQKLSPETQEVLRLAACIGHRFDLETLTIVSQKPSPDVVTDLWEAITEGLVLPLNITYPLTDLDEQSTETAEYKFAHNRVQQAIYSLIPETDKQIFHWQVGHLLLQHILPDKRAERIFDLVNQLNLGRAICVEQSEWDELAELNLQAGQKAKASAAYQPALNYLNTGIELLNLSQSPLIKDGEGTENWDRQYDLSLRLYLEAMETAYLCADFEQMELLGGIVLQQAKTLLDKTKVYEVKMLAYIAQDKLEDVVETALPVLRLLAIRFPKEPSQESITLALQEIESALAGRPAEDLIDLPEMTDPYKLAAMRILSIVSSAASLGIPGLLPLIVFKLVALSVKSGNAPESALAYVTYGSILCGRIGDIDSGYQFGQMALKLLEKLDARELKAKMLFGLNTFVSHWQEPVREGLKSLLEAYHSALEIGDLEYAVRSIFIYGLHSYLAGRELAELAPQMALHSQSISQLRQERVRRINEIYRQAVLNLIGETEQPPYLDDELRDEEQSDSPQVEETTSTVFDLPFNRLILCYLFQKYGQAVENATVAEKHLDGATAMLSVPVFHFYDSLARLALLTESPEEKKPAQEPILEKVAANQARLKEWAYHAPMNHLHKYYLVEAERGRALGTDGSAREYYDQAIALAQENQYTNEEALADELAGKFYLAKGQAEIAHVYLHKAHYAYLRWGASAKVKDLETRYPQLSAKNRPTRLEAKSTIPLTPAVHSTSSALSALDLTSVIKASQIMSSEIVLNTLLAKMMGIVIENAGAQKGYLLLEENENWSIEASGAANQDDVTVVQSIPLTVAAYGRRPILPGTVINYVIHSQQNVVLNDAAHEGQFTHDKYIVTAQPKSILCTPLFTQGKLIGILYLENNLTTEAFTPDRLEILNLLSSQAAISIENARFYAHQVKLTKAYSRFVPPEILHLLNKDSIMQVKLGDQIQQEMTVLFSDIRSFTNLSEQMTPQENFNFINSYLSRVSPIIRNHNGFIDKYMGDAIMALFPGRPSDAMQAAIAMQQAVALYNVDRVNSGYPPIRIGIGLHTGRVMLGTIGEAERMEGTVISDAVNLAARLEGLTKVYGASLIVSGQMMFSLDNPAGHNFRFLDKVKVKGKEEAVSVFEILDGEPEEVRELKFQTQADFERGLLHYHSQEFAQAKGYFQKALAVHPEDKASQLYLRRVEHFIEYGVPPDWEGIAILTEKY